MGVVTSTQITDDNDGTVIDDSLPYVIILDRTSGYGQEYHFASYASLAAWASGQHSDFQTYAEDRRTEIETGPPIDGLVDETITNPGGAI